MLPPEQDGPCNTTRVFALQEEGFGFAVLEAEDLAVAADVELTLNDNHESASFPAKSGSLCSVRGLAAAGSVVEAAGNSGKAEELRWNEGIYLARVDSLTAEGVVVGTHDDGR